jgi:hypothetical protein
VNFIYDGYHAPEMFDGEWLGAYPEGGDPELDRVIVERKKGSEDIFEDDYLDVATRPYWEEILNDYISEWFDPKDYRIYVASATLQGIEPSDLPKLSKEFIEKRDESSGTAYIYISEEACSKKKLKEFADAYHQWLFENKYYGSQDEWLFTQEGIDQLTEYNHADSRQEYSIYNTYAYIDDDEIIDGAESYERETDEQ